MYSYNKKTTIYTPVLQLYSSKYRLRLHFRPKLYLLETQVQQRKIGRKEKE